MRATAPLRRARLVFLAALCAAGALVALELPFGELLRQRGELGALTAQLQRVEGGNHQLDQAVTALRGRSTIAAIAHQDYGLVRPGQRSYVVLPGAHDTAGAANTLAARPIPASNLVPQDAASVLAGATPSVRASDGTASGGSLWSRVVDRLAFWRWAF